MNNSGQNQNVEPHRGVCLVDPDGRIVASNSSVRAQITLSTQNSQCAIADLKHLVSDPIAIDAFHQVIAGEAAFDVVRYSAPAQNGLAQTRMTLERLQGEQGPLVLVTFEAAEPRSASFLDALTGLPDRRALAERVTQWRQASGGATLVLAVLFLDLDNFKRDNDLHGHATCDLVLEELAARRVRCVREGDLVTRYGGDEFVLLLRDASSAAVTDPVIDRLREATREPIDVGPIRLEVSATIGVAMAPPGGWQIEDLVAQADQDMYARKRPMRV